MDDPELEPDYDNLTTFFEVIATESRGMLDEHMTIRTLTELVSSFSSVWRWKHGKGIYTFIYERYRIQLALFMQIMAYTASRPGAIIESTCRRHSNEALRYQVR